MLSRLLGSRSLRRPVADMLVQDRILDLSGETPPEAIRAASNRYLQTITALRNSEPLALRGESEQCELEGQGKTLLELLIRGERDSTSFCRKVGFVVYRVERHGRNWEARRYCMSSMEEKVPLGFLTFRTKKEASTACDIWYRCNRRSSSLADYCCAIQEVPSYFVSRVLDGSAGEDEKPLSVQDFEGAFEALVNFQKTVQPAFFALCLELGFDAIVDEQDSRIRAARLKDAVLEGARIPNPLPEEFVHLKACLKNLARRYKRLQSSPKRIVLNKVKADLVRHWISGGYLFLSKGELASLMNQKYGTDFTGAAIAGTCHRLKLKAHRLQSPLEQFEGKVLEERIKRTETPPILSGSFF